MNTVLLTPCAVLEGDHLQFFQMKYIFCRGLHEQGTSIRVGFAFFVKMLIYYNIVINKYLNSLKMGE